MIRTTMTAGETADTAGVVRAYKNLEYVERDFKTIKFDDLDIRPIGITWPAGSRRTC